SNLHWTQKFLLSEVLSQQEVFLLSWCYKTIIFVDVKELSTVFELNCILEGILKWPQYEQRLYKEDQFLDDGKTLGECTPATVGLAFGADDAFETLRIEPFSSPPELPDMMKPQDSGGNVNEQAVHILTYTCGRSLLTHQIPWQHLEC
ncbi:hypothetical protein U0070_006257, partial [Myodes glareolus]